ncbi:MAG: CNNM domain-containing protein, partial [bacterium]
MGEAGVVYATFVVTILIVIYAEVVPKLIAINKGDRVTRFMEPLISLLVKVISPITRAIEWIAKRSLALIGVRIDPDTHLSSPLDELRGAIDLLPEGGHSKSEERAMLHSILDLREVDVDEIMIHRQSVSMLDAS